MRRGTTRRGQPFRPKRHTSPEPHPFRQTSSGFESLISQERSEDFFFSQWLENPNDAAEFLEHGGEHRDPLASDSRSGFGVSALLHVVLLLFMLLEPNLSEFFDSPLDRNDNDRVVEREKRAPLVLFLEKPQPEQQAPPVAVVPPPAVPEAQPVPEPPPQVADNRLVIPKAMLTPETRPEIMNDLPFSAGNTDEFYTKEEVKDPGKEGTPEEEALKDVAELAESGDDELDSEGLREEELGSEVADGGEALGDFLFHTPDLIEQARQQAEAEARRRRQMRPPQPARTRNPVGEGGENGELTDIRRFLAGAQFHNLEGGLVVNTGNTMYYNDKGAYFVPWIRRMLADVGRIWRAGMPYVAMFSVGHVAVRFKVARDGTLIAYETLQGSGINGFDNIAVGAIQSADLLPLPADYPDDTFEIVLVFWYNERPYDIFG